MLPRSRGECKGYILIMENEISRCGFCVDRLRLWVAWLGLVELVGVGVGDTWLWDVEGGILNGSCFCGLDFVSFPDKYCTQTHE